MLAIEIAKNLKWSILNRQSKKYFHYSEDQFVNELSGWYESKVGKLLNIENPKRFNEKLQWLKLYDSTKEKALLADKYRVREWVASRIGDEYLFPLIGSWDNFDEIVFENLPNSFVLKTNHASSTNVIVKDKSKLNLTETRLKFERWMNTNYAFKMGFELHYGMIPPKIICEKYMGDNINDYKLFCFDGSPEFFWVDVGRYTGHKRNTYNLEWEELPFTIGCFQRIAVPKPKNLETMIKIAKELSKGFCFVRVDFYEINKKLYFGEMTFTSGSGNEPFTPDEYDYKLGTKIILPSKKSIPIKEIKEIWGS